ncbi:hypothetical protein VF21_10108 [Pseudogymnoascus sp. 05NY08]|nr:hypothetical protein VF21_10108 [Pseudogymnoascus sp. 05NY08]
MPLNEGLVNILCDESPSFKDRWLGRKLLDIAIATVAARSVSAQASEKVVKDLYQDMKAAFPYDNCFRELPGRREAEPEDPDYCYLLESLLGHIYLRGQDDAPGIVSILERNVRDPRRSQDEKYLKSPPLPPQISQVTQEERILDNASNGMATEVGSVFGSNQYIGSIPKFTPPQEVSNGNVRQLQEHADLGDLAIYTVFFEEHGTIKGTKPSYTWRQTQLKPTSRFLFTVTFEGVEVAGLECSSKQNAKHEASKALWEELHLRKQL